MKQKVADGRTRTPAEYLADIRNTMQVSGTMVRGTWITPQQRLEMIASLKN